MKQFLKGFSWILFSIVCLAYATTELYVFKPTKLFSGQKLYNPYSMGISDLRRSNFHAHSKTWGGLTNGADRIDSIVGCYIRTGYDVVGLSDYHKINSDEKNEENIFIPIYEHGINLQKSHYLAINAKRVSFFDVLLFHSNHTRQFLINHLSGFSDIVCVAHPGIRDGHSPTSLQLLSNYSHLELINGSKVARVHWDSALSAGRPVWALSNDDIHQLQEKKFAKSWTAVLASEKTPEAIIDALKVGSSFAVLENDRIEKGEINLIPIPTEFSIDKSELHIKFQEPVESISLIGQSGKVKLRLRGEKEVFYVIQDEDTYIRAEFKNSGAEVFSNPIFRWNQMSDLSNYSLLNVNIWGTFCFRISIFLIWFFLTVIFYPKVIPVIFITWSKIQKIFTHGIFELNVVK